MRARELGRRAEASGEAFMDAGVERRTPAPGLAPLPAAAIRCRNATSSAPDPVYAQLDHRVENLSDCMRKHQSVIKFACIRSFACR